MKFHMSPAVKAADIEYFESGRWKCHKSPTGAHHSAITGKTMKCKYCGEKRDVILPNKIILPYIRNKRKSELK